jgi:putative endonuclease
MITVYVLESLKDNTLYTGIAMNALTRLTEHNAGKNRFTKGHLPWKIIYTEPHESWAQARLREKYLKSCAGKIWLRNKLDEGKTGSLPARRSQAGILRTGYKGKVKFEAPYSAMSVGFLFENILAQFSCNNKKWLYE